MATKLSPKQYADRDERLSGGHRLCAGCGAGIIVRQLLMGAKDNPVVVSNATGCLEVSTTIYPYTAWKDSFIHSAFENAAATISGVEAAYKSLNRQGRVKSDKPYRFLSIAGDGGSYDIGLQAISGALERGHDIVIACYDNGAYMNTGFQRSAATPRGAWTTTCPDGKASIGKTQNRKNLSAIAVAHGIPYVAQASPHNFRDLIAKAETAFETPGPAFLNILSPCPRGWRSADEMGMTLAKMMVESRWWPLYEVIDGDYKLSYDPKKRTIPVRDWMKLQGRFKHLFTPANEHVLEEAQAQTDLDWERLMKLCSLSGAVESETPAG